MTRKILYVCLILIVASVSFAADHYVRENGSGDGSNWTNAWDDLPATLIRGDTYYVADGSYSGYTFDDAGTSRIYIIKCGTGDGTCENATGYSSGDHDGQATFGALTFSNGYYNFDGQTRDGNDWFDGSAYGFVVNPGGTGDRINIHGSYVNIKYTYVVGRDRANYSRWAIQYGRDGAPVTDVVVSYCLVTKDSNHFFLRYADNCTVEYNASYDAQTGGEADHGENVNLYYTDNHIIRYNIFKDSGTVAWVTAVIAIADSSNCEIYGNLFWGNSTGDGTMGWFSANAGNAVYNTKIYNNTIVNATGVQTGIMFETSSSSGNVAYNNLWINSGTPYYSRVTHDYNGYSGASDEGEANGQPNLPTSIFTNYSGGDFTLSGTGNVINTGKSDLGAQYADDMLGVERDADAGWDIGAYEFSSSSNPVAVLTGTLSDNATEAQIAAGGETLIITLTDDTWDTDIGSDNAKTTALIVGIDSAQAEGTGWDAVVRVDGETGLTYANVSSPTENNTVVTITLPPFGSYAISDDADETITVTIPASALTAAGEVVATPQFTILAADTTGPVLSSEGPSGAQSCPQDPTTIRLIVTTDEDAWCRYGTTDISYDAMSGSQFTNGEGLTGEHYVDLSLDCDSAYTRYITCVDSFDNEDDPPSTFVTFTISEQQSTWGDVTGGGGTTFGNYSLLMGGTSPDFAGMVLEEIHCWMRATSGTATASLAVYNGSAGTSLDATGATLIWGKETSQFNETPQWVSVTDGTSDLPQDTIIWIGQKSETAGFYYTQGGDDSSDFFKSDENDNKLVWRNDVGGGYSQDADATVDWNGTITDGSQSDYGYPCYIVYSISGGDTTAPTLDTITISADGEEVAMRFSESVSESGTGSDWTTFTLSRGAVTLSNPSVVGSEITYTLSRVVLSDETLTTLVYTQPGDGIEDNPAGNDLATIPDNFAGTFTNNSTQGTLRGMSIQ